MKPSKEWQSRLDYIASRQDRHLIPRDGWTERYWRAQRKEDAEKRARRSELLASLDRPVVIPPSPTVAAFSLSDRTRDDDRQRRVEANRILEKHGARPRPW